MAVLTNPHVSSVHAAAFGQAIKRARNEAELKKAAGLHSDYLLGDDKARLRDAYTVRLGEFRGLK